MTPCPQEVETFWTLLHDAAHWEFELFLMVVFDGVVGALLWPFVRKHWNHHLARDEREAAKEGRPSARKVAQSLRYLCEVCTRASADAVVGKRLG